MKATTPTRSFNQPIKTLSSLYYSPSSPSSPRYSLPYFTANCSLSSLSSPSSSHYSLFYRSLLFLLSLSLIPPPPPRHLASPYFIVHYPSFQVSARTSTSTSSSTILCCWNSLDRMSCSTIPCRALYQRSIDWCMYPPLVGGIILLQQIRVFPRLPQCRDISGEVLLGCPIWIIPLAQYRPGSR